MADIDKVPALGPCTFPVCGCERQVLCEHGNRRALEPALVRWLNELNERDAWRKSSPPLGRIVEPGDVIVSAPTDRIVIGPGDV